MTLLVTLCIGFLGGAVFVFLGTPLPWLLGSMFGVAATSITGMNMKMPAKFRNAGLAIVGTLSGSAYGPESFDHVSQWVFTLSGIAIYAVLTGVLCYAYLRKAAGYDEKTAFFSGMPGGLNEMVIVGTEMGGDTRIIALSHAVRVMLTILLVTTFFKFSDGLTSTAPFRGGTEGFDLLEQVLLISAAAAGAAIGYYFRLPAPFFFGPMLISIAVHLTGLVAAAPVAPVSAAAQLVIGCALGARFSGTRPGSMLPVIRHSAVTTLIACCVGALFAIGLSGVTAFHPKEVFIAYAPAGIAEMTILSLAMGFDAAFVAVHHLARIVIVFAGAPIVFKVLQNRWPP